MPRRTDISSILIVGGLLAACSAEAPVAPPDPRAERIASLEKISAGCGLPASTLKLTGADEVAIQLPGDVDDEKFDCLLMAIRKADPKLKFGFVGNESYDVGNQR